MSADQLRATWQARAILFTRDDPVGMAVLSIIANSWDDAMPFLMRAIIPGFVSLTTPFLTSTAKINKAGYVVANVLWEDWSLPEHDHPIFTSPHQLRGEMRRLADKLRLDDDERRALFAAIKKWLVADQRLDPNFDPADPDAKRLVMH